MLIKTEDLTGVALGWAVAKADGYPEKFLNDTEGYEQEFLEYATSWAIAGPIIERELIDVTFSAWDDIDAALPLWHAVSYDSHSDGRGNTPLVAAMRCFVDNKLGDVIDVPDELCKEVA